MLFMIVLIKCCTISFLRNYIQEKVSSIVKLLKSRCENAGICNKKKNRFKVFLDKRESFCKVHKKVSNSRTKKKQLELDF